jgi:20S proteasome subunit alpha 4
MQDSRTIRKIVKLDKHLTLAFAGLTADARVLIDKARMECQSYRLTCEDAPSPGRPSRPPSPPLLPPSNSYYQFLAGAEYVARFIASTQQKYTQRGGMRPFGVSSMLAGFSSDGQPQIYQTDPAGTYSAWKANAIGGKNAKNMREFLEKNWEQEMEDAAAIKLCVKALLEVVDSGAKNMEICLVRKDKPAETMGEEAMEAVIAEIEAEIEEAKVSSGGEQKAE